MEKVNPWEDTDLYFITNFIKTGYLIGSCFSPLMNILCFSGPVQFQLFRLITLTGTVVSSRVWLLFLGPRTERHTGDLSMSLGKPSES